MICIYAGTKEGDLLSFSSDFFSRIASSRLSEPGWRRLSDFGLDDWR